MYFQLLSHFSYLLYSLVKFGLDWYLKKLSLFSFLFFLKVDLLSVPLLHVNDSFLFLGIALSLQILVVLNSLNFMQFPMILVTIVDKF